MNDLHHPSQGARRGSRIARLLVALTAFAATTASLHALSDHYGWRHGHWGAHHHSHGLPGGWGAPAGDAPRSAPKEPT